MLIIAHRGASGSFPENTLRAFRAAVDEGADLCELDVRTTRDSAVVVIHDETVDRTTDGSGAVKDLTLAQIRKLDAGSKLNERFRGERIPTLEQVFDAVHPKCGLNIEIKSKGGERRVCEVMKPHLARGTTLVSSFDVETLKRVREIDPSIRLGVLAEKNPQAMIEAAVALHAYAVNPRFDMANADLVSAAHLRRLRVLAWAVDDQEAMRLLVTNGVDGIMTNYPARLKEVIST